MPMKMKTPPTQRLNHRLKAALGERLVLRRAVDLRAEHDYFLASSAARRCKLSLGHCSEVL